MQIHSEDFSNALIALHITCKQNIGLLRAKKKYKEKKEETVKR